MGLPYHRTMINRAFEKEETSWNIYSTSPSQITTTATGENLFCINTAESQSAPFIQEPLLPHQLPPCRWGCLSHHQNSRLAWPRRQAHAKASSLKPPPTPQQASEYMGQTRPRMEIYEGPYEHVEGCSITTCIGVSNNGKFCLNVSITSLVRRKMGQTPDSAINVQ